MCFIRIFAGTWNVACQLPTDDLNIEEWLDINEAADIYVIGQVSNPFIFLLDLLEYQL